MNFTNWRPFLCRSVNIMIVIDRSIHFSPWSCKNFHIHVSKESRIQATSGAVPYTCNTSTLIQFRLATVTLVAEYHPNQVTAVHKPRTNPKGSWRGAFQIDLKISRQIQLEGIRPTSLAAWGMSLSYHIWVVTWTFRTYRTCQLRPFFWIPTRALEKSLTWRHDKFSQDSGSL